MKDFYDFGANVVSKTFSIFWETVKEPTMLERVKEWAIENPVVAGGIAVVGTGGALLTGYGVSRYAQEKLEISANAKEVIAKMKPDTLKKFNALGTEIKKAVLKTLDFTNVTDFGAQNDKSQTITLNYIIESAQKTLDEKKSTKLSV